MAVGALAGAATGTAAAPGIGTLMGAGIGALGSLAGGIISGNAAEAAAAKQAEAMREALAFQKERYAEAQGNLDPYINTGTKALGDYAGLVQGMTQPEYGYKQEGFDFNVNQDPGAQYAMQQAQQAINASSIARGAVGGGAVKSMNTAIQDKGNEAFQGSYNRWLDKSKLLQGQADNAYQRANDFQLNKIKATGAVAGSGQEAANTLAGVGTNAGTQVGNTLGELGSARAGGTMGMGNALAQGVTGLASGIGSGMASQSQQGLTSDWINKLLQSGNGTSGGIQAPAAIGGGYA